MSTAEAIVELLLFAIPALVLFLIHRTADLESEGNVRAALCRRPRD